jgi:hypothetical protein
MLRLHMSPIGTSRQYATTQQFDRFRNEADSPYSPVDARRKKIGTVSDARLLPHTLLRPSFITSSAQMIRAPRRPSPISRRCCPQRRSRTARSAQGVRTPPIWIASAFHRGPGMSATAPKPDTESMLGPHWILSRGAQDQTLPPLSPRRKLALFAR